MKMIEYVKHSKFHTLLSVLLAILSSAITTWISFILSDFLDSAIALDYQKALFFLLLEITLLVIAILINYWNNKVIDTIRKRSMILYRKYIYRNIENTASKIDIDAYISAMNNDAVHIDATIKSVFDMINEAMKSISAFIGLILLHWVVAFVNVVVIVLNYGCSSYLEKKIEKNEIERSEIMEKFTSSITDIVQGFSVWNLYNAKEKMVHSLQKTSEEYEDKRKHVNRVDTYITDLVYVISAISQMISSFVMLFLIIKGYASVGAFMSEGQLSGQLSNNVNTAFNNLAHLRGIDTILQKRTEQIAEEDKTIQNIISYNLSIQNLSFSYPDKTIFSNVSLHFESGKKYLIIGPSGYGKTTLLNLIDKNLTEYTGSIVLGEKDYSELNHATVHHYIGYVEQTPYIFKDTLKENITLGNTYTGEEIQRAMQEALVTDFMNDEDDVIDPNGISGGQKQRIALARELIADHKIILFDESINALDKAMTKEIVKQLLSLKQTVILVSHSYDEEMMKKFDCVIDISKC